MKKRAINSKFILIIALIIVLQIKFTYSQNVAINSTGTAPNVNAMLDIFSN